MKGKSKHERGKRDRKTTDPAARAKARARAKAELAKGVKTLLGTIEGCDIWIVEHKGVLRVEFVAKMAICNDGSGGNLDNDPYHQSELAFYNNGEFLNPYTTPYTVVPPLIRNADIGVVMGCQSMIVNLDSGLGCASIVGDQGPSEKLGEASVEAAKRCGLSGDPNSGGTDEHCILYLLWPDKAATVDGITYTLQPS